MPRSSLLPARARPAARALVGLPLLILAALAALPSAACSRQGAVEQTTDEEDADAIVGVDAGRADAADAADARDARSDLELAAIADAGRLCGEKGLPDCPLQGWMKRNATTMIGFGETTTLAEVFDQIAQLAPPAGLTREAYTNWAWIARDGAAASRMGNIPAARAACRGCHQQYTRSYHAELRGLQVASIPLGQPP